MDTERGLQNPHLELDKSAEPTSTQKGRIFRKIQSSPRWQNIGRGAAIFFTFAASLTGGTPAKAGPSEDGNGPGCKTAEGFQLGFKVLADQIPCEAGTPLEAEHWGVNGDSLQQTTTGLMVWRKADNWTAFTDGSRSWINGPFGVQSRTNNERFDWEKQAEKTINPTGQIQIIENEAGPIFTQRVQEALNLLKEKDPEHYQLVAEAGIIKFLKGMGNRGGVALQQEPYKILLGESVLNDSLVSIAGTLGHEATHIKQERRYLAEHPGETFSAPGTSVGIQADGEALEVQAQICERLGDSYSASYYRTAIGIYDGTTVSAQKALEAFQALQAGK